MHVNVPGYFKIITFCSKIQLQFLSNSARWYTVPNLLISLLKATVDLPWLKFSTLHINYTLSLSICKRNINICDKVPAPETWYIYQNAEMNTVHICRKENACIVIHNFLSDTLYKSAKCFFFFLATSTELYPVIIAIT